MTSVGDRAAKDVPAVGRAEPVRSWIRPARARERPRRIVVAALREEVGATTTAVLLGLALAAEHPDRVAVVDATPYAGGLAARLLPPPSPGGTGTLPHRPTLRAVDPDAPLDACAAAAVGDENVVVVDVGAELAAAVRPELLADADQVVLVDSVTGDAASRSAVLEWLGVQGHPGLARGAVTVLVATEPPVAAADPPVVVSFDEGSRAVVRVAFDPHLASTGIVDLAMLAGSTVAAVRELAKRVSGSGADDSPSPALTDRSTGSLEGLRVPALVVDAPGAATGLPTPQETSPATSAAPVGGRGRRRSRPGLTVVVCAVVAVVLAIFASGATGEDASASIAAACGSGSPGGQLPDHDGHPTTASSCVQTPFGAVSAQEKNPTLLIVAAPSTITPGQDIELRVSVRNLVRDDFPTSAHGGYLSEPASLTSQGFTRGHVHSACRVLPNTQEAPQPDRVTAFMAIEDGGGGAAPDTVEVHLPGRDVEGRELFAAGSLVQCTAWAGDGSHRVPMDAFPNQMPAVDAVRINVVAG